MTIPYKHLVSIASMACLVAGAAACAASDSDKPDASKGDDKGSDKGNDGDGPPGAGSDPPPPQTGPFVYPASVHTGFDGSHTFKVPVTSDLVGVTWSVEDPSIATIQKVPIPSDYGNRCDIGSEWAMVTPKKAGTTRIFAKTADKTATATLVVASYDPAIYGAGDRRYNTPDNATAQRPSCASCHKTATGVDHSPFTTAGYADDDIVSAITTGVFKKSGYHLSVAHSWNLTDAEKQGIMPYLRALPPHGF